MLEYADEKRFIGLCVPPVHGDLHVVNVGQEHIQFPVKEGRGLREPSAQTQNKIKNHWPKLGTMPHSQPYIETLKEQ